MNSAKRHRWVRGFVDWFGLLAFLVAFLATRDLISASWALAGGSAVALLVGFVAERRIAPMPLISGVFALGASLLTVVFQDERFVKMKPTVVNLLFFVALVGGLLLRKNPLKMLMGEALTLPDEAWRTLTVRYALFFLFMAGLNELVWRTQPNEIWVPFRFPGMIIITVVFSLSQAPFFMKHHQETPPPPSE